MKKLSLFTRNGTAAFLTGCNQDPIWGPRMASIYKANGFTPDCDYLYDLTSSHSFSALCRYLGSMYVICPPAETEILHKSLLKNREWVALEGYEETILPLSESFSLRRSESSYWMIHSGETLPIEWEGSLSVKKSENLPLFYSFISSCHKGFDSDQVYSLWFRDYASRIGSGETELFILYQKETPVACATLNVQSASYGVLGSVSTLPAWRGKGYGSLISRYVTNVILEKGLTPTLQCSEDSLKEFYLPLGYQIGGRWMTAERD